MNLIIRNNSDMPIYEQIKEQIKNLIIKGEMKEGDALPSLRFLALNLRISVITTKRAYEDLERDGFIESVVGKGSFVLRKNVELIKEEQLKKIENKMIEILEIGKTCKLSLKELQEMLEVLDKGV